jgi:hypothetical protein
MQRRQNENGPRENLGARGFVVSAALLKLLPTRC